MGFFSTKDANSIIKSAFQKSIEFNFKHAGQVAEFQTTVKGIFQTKLARVNGDKNLYSESMLSNVGYFVITREHVFSLFYHHFQQKKGAITQEQFWGWVEGLQETVKKDMPKYVEERFRKSFSGFSLEKRIDELEFSYLFNSASHQIILTAVCELLSNSEDLKYLQKQSFEEVIQVFNDNLGFATNYRIGNISAQKAG